VKRGGRAVLTALGIALAALNLSAGASAATALKSGKGREMACPSETPPQKLSKYGNRRSKSKSSRLCSLTPQWGVIVKCGDGTFSKKITDPKLCAGHGGVVQRFGL
jgi:hypothetical protein